LTVFFGSRFMPTGSVYLCPSNHTRETKTGNSIDVVAFDATTKRFTTAFRGHEQGIIGLAVAANGKVLATSDLGGNVKIWDLSLLK